MSFGSCIGSSVYGYQGHPLLPAPVLRRFGLAERVTKPVDGSDISRVGARRRDSLRWLAEPKRAPFAGAC